MYGFWSRLATFMSLAVVSRVWLLQFLVCLLGIALFQIIALQILLLVLWQPWGRMDAVDSLHCSRFRLSGFNCSWRSASWLGGCWFDIPTLVYSHIFQTLGDPYGMSLKAADVEPLSDACQGTIDYLVLLCCVLLFYSIDVP